MRIIFLFSLLISRCNKNQISFKTYTVIIFVKCRKEQGTFFLGTYTIHTILKQFIVK